MGWRFPLLLLLLVACCYLPGLEALPAHDDQLLTREVLGPPTPGALLGRFLDPVRPHGLGIPLPNYAYRPLTEASFSLNLAGGFLSLRVLNLLLHWGACLAVLWVAAQLFPAERHLGRWAALCFAVHPLAVSAVTYVYQRAASLEALLAFLSLGLYWSARVRMWGGRYLGALGCGLMAVMAKETGATLPLMLAAVEWILRDPAEPLRAVWKRWLPFLLLPAVVLLQALRAASLASAAGGPRESLFRPGAGGPTPLGYLLGELPVLVHYLRLSSLPFPRHFLYDHEGMGFLPWPVAGGLVAVLVAWVLWGPEAWRLPRLGLALFLAPLALESSVFPIRDIAFDHRCYPGLLGVALLFGGAVLSLGRLPGPWRLLPGAALLCLAALTLVANRDWTDTRRLLGSDVRGASRNPEAWSGYAAWRLASGHPEAALPLYRRARSLPWQDVGVCVGQARALEALGRRPQAREILDEAMVHLPRDPGLLWEAVEEARRAGDEGRQEVLADRGEGLEELRIEMVIWLARRRVAQGRLPEARALLVRQADHFPQNAVLREHLDWVLRAEKASP